MDKCVGITTNGCSVKQSEKCGTDEQSKLLKTQIKFVITCSCINHALNLSIIIINVTTTTKRCKQKFIGNAFGMIKGI